MIDWLLETVEVQRAQWDALQDHRTLKDWYPGQCACGGAVALSGEAPHRRQFIDLPILKPLMTEHRLHHGYCGRCGASQYAKLPKALSRSAFGAEWHATVALLSAQFQLSDRMIQDYLQQFYHLPISLGSISAIQGRVEPCGH